MTYLLVIVPCILDSGATDKATHSPMGWRDPEMCYSSALHPHCVKSPNILAKNQHGPLGLEDYFAFELEDLMSQALCF